MREREREAREEAVRGQIQAQQQIEEAERRMVATMKKWKRFYKLLRGRESKLR